MSRLDDMKEQIKASWQVFWQKVQETPTYVQLQDRYQTLSPGSQKLVKLLGIVTFVFILVAYPMGLYFTSQESITSFEEKRNLIRDLFKTYREASAQPDIAIPPTADSLRSSINGILTSADLTDEQKSGGILDAPTDVDNKLIPKSLASYALEVNLSKLNIRQIVDIGARIVGISDSVKMKDMKIVAHASDTRYFDVTFKLFSLNVPEPAPEPPPEIEKPTKKNSKSDEPKDSDE